MGKSFSMLWECAEAAVSMETEGEQRVALTWERLDTQQESPPRVHPHDSSHQDPRLKVSTACKAVRGQTVDKSSPSGGPGGRTGASSVMSGVI